MGQSHPMHILFDEAGKLMTGRLMSEAESSLQVELDSGKRVKVTLSKSSKAGYNNRGDMVLYTKITTKKGKVSVRTYGNKFYLRVTYSAPATSTAAAYKQTKVYLVRK